MKRPEFNMIWDSFQLWGMYKPPSYTSTYVYGKVTEARHKPLWIHMWFN